MRLPVIDVPAPWGLGVVLGLVDRVIQPLALPPAVYQVQQSASLGDMLGACEELARLAMAQGKPAPAECAPWGAAVFRGRLGTVRVIRAEPRPRGGWWVSLAQGRADWSYIRRAA